jgi:hypothetical protein
MTFSRFKPAVSKCWLFAASGMMWSAVGLMMCATGIGWLMHGGRGRPAWYGAAGVVLAVAATRWAFGRLARRNIRRLRQLPERGCFFAFQAWKSYLVIVFMIALGIGLRQSPIPRQVLAVVYLAVGGALALSSTLYYRHLMRLVRCGMRRRTGRRAAATRP